MTWKTITVGASMVRVKRAGKLKKTEYLESGKFPVIDQGVTDIAGFTNNHSIVHNGPLPIVIFGDHTRRVKLAKNPFVCGADGTQLLYPDDTILDPKFYYYAIKNIDLSNYHYARHFKFLKEQEFTFPIDLKQQKRIAEVLSAYDDLIENNRRRIALLEEAARLIYREWFVHFRFPNHATTKFENGLPAGWTKIPASDAMQINPTTKWSKFRSNFMTSVPMAALSETNMTCNPNDFEFREEPTSVKFVNGDTLFARITPCLENGKTGYVDFLENGEVACGSTEFIVLRERLVSRYYCYLLAREESFRQNAVKSMIGSSGRQRVQPACFDKYLVAVPSEKVAKKFDKVVRPKFEQISRLAKHNHAITKARDLILPRLMDGKITV